MKNKNLAVLISVILAACTLLSLIACAAPAAAPAPSAPAVTPAPSQPAKTFNLTFTSFSPLEDTKNSVGNVGWFKWLEKQSGGRIKVTPYWAGSAVSAPDTLKGISDGVVSMGDPASIFAGRDFPLNDLVLMPFVFGWPSSRACILTHLALLEKYPQMKAEYEKKGVKIIGAHQASVSQMCTTKGSIRTLADWKGKVINNWSWIESKSVSLLGGTPEAMPPADVYDALSKGVLDGTTTSLHGAVVWGWGDTFKYGTMMSLSPTYWLVVMNKGVFDSMPADLQSLFTGENMLRYSQLQGYIFEQDEWADKIAIEKKFASKGAQKEWYVLPSEERSKWAAATSAVKDEWIAKANSLGAPGQQMYDDLLKFADQYSWEKYPNQSWYLPTLKEWGAKIPDYWTFDH